VLPTRIRGPDSRSNVFQRRSYGEKPPAGEGRSAAVARSATRFSPIDLEPGLIVAAASVLEASLQVPGGISSFPAATHLCGEHVDLPLQPVLALNELGAPGSPAALQHSRLSTTLPGMKREKRPSSDRFELIPDGVRAIITTP
jgi:hypothetical protein